MRNNTSITQDKLEEGMGQGEAVTLWPSVIEEEGCGRSLGQKEEEGPCLFPNHSSDWFL